MVPAPSAAATRRIETASKPSASAIVTAVAAIPIRESRCRETAREDVRVKAAIRPGFLLYNEVRTMYATCVHCTLVGRRPTLKPGVRSDMLAINREALARLKSAEVRAVARHHWARLLGTIGLHPVPNSPERPGRPLDERHPPHPRHPSHRQPAGHKALHQGRQVGDGVNRSAAELAAGHADLDGALLRGARDLLRRLRRPD